MQKMFGIIGWIGTVLVFGPTTGVRLTPGLGTNIATPGAEPTAPTLWGKPRNGAALASVGG